MVNTIFLLKLKKPELYSPDLEIVRGFVIVAETEGHARLLASQSAGDEGDGAWQYGREKCTVAELGRAAKTVRAGIALRDHRTR